jgi:hypothetical protein
MRYCAFRTDILTAPAKHHTCIQILYNCFLCTIRFLKPKCLHVAKIHAFSAGNAFFIIDFWSPRYFVSGYSFVCFFIHRLSLSIFILKGGPGQGFEPWQKAPQASRLPSYLTPATIIFYRGFFAWVNHLRFYSILTCLFEALILTKIDHVFRRFALEKVGKIGFCC